jgi:hypothetical protein
MKSPASILTLIAILGAGYVARTWFRDYFVSMVTNKASTCLEMLGNSTTEEEGQTYITGSIKNNCDRSFGSVTIVFKVDQSSRPSEDQQEGGPTEGLATGVPTVDLPEGFAYAYSRDVKAGEVREFKTAISVSRNSSYRFDEINAF